MSMQSARLRAWKTGPPLERMQFSGGGDESGYVAVVHVGAEEGGETHLPCTDTELGGPFFKHCVLNA